MPDSPSISRAGYRTLAKRTVYENAWLRFEAHDITHPNGVRGEHGVVVPPEASAIVVVDGRDVLLTRQARYAIDDIVLEVVKGGCDDGETALQGAQRETREEIGMIATRWDALGMVYEIPSVVQTGVTLFLARDCASVAAGGEAVETIDLVRVPFETALAMCEDGRINDAVTGVALLRARALLTR